MPQGFVRRCHGDLHLRNVCLLDGRPTLFDCIEFSNQVACIDVLYDLAFLLMDLLHRELGVHAHVVYNEYVTATGDLDGLALLPLFLSERAAVRARTSATAARLQSDPADQAALGEVAREYLDLALSLIEPAPAQLVASVVSVAPASPRSPDTSRPRSARRRERSCSAATSCVSRCSASGCWTDSTRRATRRG